MASLQATNANQAENDYAAGTMAEEKDDEQVAAEMRERADKVLARRAAARAAGKSEASEDDSKKKGKKERRWYHWLIDIALFGMAAYLIWVRFIRKDPNQQPMPASSSSASSSASAGPSASGSSKPIMAKAATEVRAGAGLAFGPIETLAAPTPVELLEAPANGWVKIKTPSGKTGFVPIDSIQK